MSCNPVKPAIKPDIDLKPDNELKPEPRVNLDKPKIYIIPFQPAIQCCVANLVKPVSTLSDL